MNKRLIIGAIGMTAVLGFGFILKSYFAAQKKDPPKKQLEAISKFVKTQKVAYQEVNAQIEAFGRVVTSQPLDITAEASGRIKEASVPLKEGQKFNSGVVIFKIDDGEQKLSLQALKSTFMKDIAVILPELKTDYPESFATWQSYFQQIELNKNLPEMPTHRSEKEKTFLATKNIYTNYFNIKSREANLEKFTSTAPFAGSIAEVYLQAGSVANVGTKIAKLVRTDRLELVVPIDVSQIRFVKIGATVNISSEDNEMKWTGTVSRVGEIVSQQTQSLDVFITLTPNENPIYDGMYLKASMGGVNFAKAMSMPRNAIVNNNQVFILENDSILRISTINILKINKEMVLFSGIDEGTELVIEPVLGGFNGLKVFKLKE